MSYESVGDIAPNFFAAVATQKTIQNWRGSAKPLSQVKTKKDVADYAAAGYRVCIKQGWIAAGDAYWLAFSEIDKGSGAGYISSRLIPLLRSANSMAAAMVPKPEVGVKPEVIVEVTPDAMPPRQAGLSFMNMSPLMMAAAAAGFWFVVLPAVRGKKGRSKPRKGKKPRRASRRKGRR